MLLRRVLACILLVLVLTQAGRPADPPPDAVRGDRLLWSYLRTETQKLADACLTDVKSKEDWEKKRPELRRQFLDMLGLVAAAAAHRPQADHHRQGRNRHSSPSRNCTSSRVPACTSPRTCTFPRRSKPPAPAILYVCGHANTVIDKVSYGSKVNYQHHPAWFAEHGYVCLILDTLQLGEIQGMHHGTYRRGMWWWQALGYTPAGIELLERHARPRLPGDAQGGGCRSASASPAAPAAGQRVVGRGRRRSAAVHHPRGRHRRFARARRRGRRPTASAQTGVITGHCDCMYFREHLPLGLRRGDGPVRAAAAAAGQQRRGRHFPCAGYRRLADKAQTHL